MLKNITMCFLLPVLLYYGDVPVALALIQNQDTRSTLKCLEITCIII